MSKALDGIEDVLKTAIWFVLLVSATPLALLMVWWRCAKMLADEKMKDLDP